ncbi:serine hydrolase domain-containing protein [Luteibacter aegosomatissinici]|uniref:serine hydrolase domain-containing protein n=1 Tax=Luteibacter aegosomatissinici TaxID=2911539 RepID=UPI001FFB3F48|nr:serine hydrolase domain-containing protein [Luteibacter aegosomatissinici]UPG93888.1 beta-lactamase family protein [Luteibacter aegosomatissinici]
MCTATQSPEPKHTASEVALFTKQADAIVDRLTQPTGPGASVTVTRNGQVIYQAARGEASVELHVPMKPGNILRIGSITKTVTAATILTLVHQGKLSLSDPLSRFFPDFPEGSTITIAQLLSHTAGISDAWNADPTQPLDTKTLVVLIAKQPLDFKPGSEWRYSNSGYMLLGAVIEKVTGKPWRDAMAELVLAPFGMTHTDYFADDVVVPSAAQGYSADATGKTTRPPFVSITGPMTAGALTSTSQDIAQLGDALNNPLMFPPDLLKAMTTPAKLSDGTEAPYGYGLFPMTVRGEPAYGHNGGIEGFSSQFVYIPKAHVSVAVLVNSDAGTPSARAIALQLAAAAIGKPYKTFVDKKLDDKQRQAIVGNYRIDGNSVHAITQKYGELYVQRAPGPKRHLVSAEGDVLYYAGEGTDYFHVVKGADGRVTAVEFFSDGMAPPRIEKRAKGSQ